MNAQHFRVLATTCMFIGLCLGILNCKQSGGGITDSGDQDTPGPTEEPEEITSRFESEDTSFLPGQLHRIAVEGTELTKEEYSAQLDNGTELILYRTEDEEKILNIFIPVLATGDYTLQLSLKEQDQALDFTIGEYEPIPDPEQYIQNENEELEVQWQNYTEYLDNLMENGSIDQQTIAHDIAVWENIAQEAQQEWAAMDEAQELRVATLIEANKGWLDQLDTVIELIETETAPQDSGMVKRRMRVFQNQSCEDLRNEGQYELTQGNTFNAAMTALRYKWCQVDLMREVFPTEEIKKVKIWWEATENQYAQYTLINLIGRKIDQASKWFDEQGNSTLIAEEIEAVNESGYLKSSSFGSSKQITNSENEVLTFPNGENKKVYARIQFRSLNESDVSTGNDYSDLASMFSEFVASYDVFANSLDQDLVWRPGFRNKTETVNFNHFLSLPEESISNDKVIFLNTQRDGDDWEVALATDEETDQEFTFNLVYDDGWVRLEKSLSGVVAHNTNKFVYDGKEYPLGWGYIIDYGEDNYVGVSRAFQFYLTQKEGTYIHDENYYDISNSEYAIALLPLYSLGPSSFDAGTYPLGDNDYFLQQNHLGRATFRIDDESGSADYHYIKDGVVEVSISGDVYTLEFDFILDNGKSLIGRMSYPFPIVIAN